MLDGTCPKCGSDQVYCDPFRASPYDRLWVGNFFHHKKAYFRTYICTDCGYTEKYIADRDFLQRIRQKWHKVRDEKKKKRGEGSH
jgi:predicted nucleic-acid-binding Zn-ribbon protein